MIEVYTDGATSGNPGLSGAGIVIVYEGMRKTYSVPLGMMTNHQAEFWAIIKALEICQNDHPEAIISLRSDSQAAVQAIDKEHTKNKDFQPLLEQILQLSSGFPYFFIKWIPEKQNKAADQLAREAIRQLQ
ncbi:ribonuclease HI family protein [Terribacillus sp. DMT04]|uniref:ribonuclease HI family protein n=1 Tax=Terribacillus sp. DMT04 TaxID=2850441 RepID=UPI001C2BA0D1|nr:ribonuclease HI family protein [Terribacillus sp. DMT04]QXE00225.1 ribonuclease HI family protein [Terribacillus sp. DMT04]